MTLRDRLTAHEDGLTQSERKVASVLLRSPQQAAYLSAAEVAAKSEVHESSVIRMAQKLGYKGYAALRQDLRNEASRVDMSARAKLREHESHELARLAADEAAAILRMAEMIDQDELDAVATTLWAAKRTFVYGAPILVDCLRKRLRRVGIDSVGLSPYGSELPDLASTMTSDDVLFSFVLREPYAPMAVLTQHTHSVGAKSVVVVDEVGLQLSPRPTHLLTALRGADANFRTMVVPMVLCYGLELALYHQQEDRASAALDRLTALNEVFTSQGIAGSRRVNGS